MKMLIADDEDYTREGLIEAINWDKFGVDEIMQAVNGAEAAGIAQWFKPDIIISDIRMPQMNGLEFAEKLMKMNSDCRIIFISGYMEIDYLKSAIRLSAVDFIEKPVDLRALDGAITRAVEEIRRIHDGKAVVVEHRGLQNQKLFRLLTGKDADERTLDKLCTETGMMIKGKCFQCIAAISRRKDTDADEELRLLEEALKASDFEVLSSYHEEKRQFEFIIILQEKMLYRLTPLFQNLLERFPDLCIGIGMEAKSFRNVYNSYNTADIAINGAFYLENERWFTIDETIVQKTFVSPSIYGEFLHMMSGPVVKLEEWCSEFFESLSRQKYYRKEQIYTLMISLLSALRQKYPYLLEAYPKICGEDSLSAFIMELDTLKEIKEIFFQALDEIKIHQQEQFGYSKIVCGVQDYIERHYGEEGLSITEIAEQLHLSPAYLNVLFKQEMKMTLKQYLSNYRLEKAKRMLEYGYAKITEIAEQCGYANSNYFSKVFKEAMDMSPLEYRRQLGNDDEV